MSISHCAAADVRIYEYAANSRIAAQTREWMQESAFTDNDPSTSVLILHPKSRIGDTITIRLEAADMGLTANAIVRKYLGADVDLEQWSKFIGKDLGTHPSIEEEEED